MEGQIISSLISGLGCASIASAASTSPSASVGMAGVFLPSNLAAVFAFPFDQVRAKPAPLLDLAGLIHGLLLFTLGTPITNVDRVGEFFVAMVDRKLLDAVKEGFFRVGHLGDGFQSEQ